MNKQFKVLLYKIYRPFFIWWSNFYWITEAQTESLTRKELAPEDYKQPEETISEYVMRKSKEIMKYFQYIPDGPEQLGDSVPPPHHMYRIYKSQLGTPTVPYADDCDGYHATISHFLACNGYKPYLLSIHSLNNKFGHAVCAYHANKEGDDGLWHICDYVCDYYGPDLISIIKHTYNYSTDGSWIAFLAEYDYDKYGWCRVPLDNNVYDINDEKLNIENGLKGT